MGWLVLGARPHELELVYDVSAAPDATALEVDLRAGGALVRHARLALRPGEAARHRVRLRDGTYVLSWRIERPGSAIAGERTLEVEGDQTVVLPLGR